MSLRARLLVGVGLVAIVLAAVAVLITTTTRSRLIDQLDDRLAASASDNRGSVFDRGEPPKDHGDRGDDRAGAPPDRQSDFYEGAIRADGTTETFFVPNIGGDEYSPPDIDIGSIDFVGASDEYLTVSAREGSLDYRVLVQITASGDGAFLTALPLTDVESTIDQLTSIVLGATAFVLAVLGLVTWWMLRLGIRPIKQVTTTASTIAAGDLSARADESVAAVEPRELAIALNTMMHTIESSIAERDESDERLRRFISDASHELRTPVTTIRGYAELYRSGGLSNSDDLDDAMRRTEAEASRMARLVEDMLTLAKLDEHRPLEHRPVDISQLARDAVADAKAVDLGRPVEYVGPDSAMVDGDDDRLRQVFANLVNNALTHTDPDVAVTITVHEPKGGRVAVEVHDDGPGMSTDVAERITERFFRADPSRSRQRGGSGLGLAIVEATVIAHDGTINVDSAPGTGTSVVIDLPAAR